MNNTLTLPQLVQMVASSAGITTDEAKIFITTLTDHVKTLLASGEKASLPGIGTFAAIDAPDGNTTVIFAPDDSFADAVNEPFAMFEPIELLDDAELDVAESDWSPTAPKEDTSDIPVDNKTIKPDTESATYEPDGNEAPVVTDNQDNPVQSDVTDYRLPAEQSIEQESAAASLPDTPTTSLPTTPVVITKPSRQYRLGWLCTGIVIGFIIGYLVTALIYTQKGQYSDTDYDASYEEEYIDQATPQTDVTDNNTDVTESESTATSTIPTGSTILCQDTVTAKRYITHMARDYYGDRNFWVYIYEANKEVLGHPERTLPGTVVNIPTPASIPANPSNPDDIRNAKTLAAEIYSRFQ